MDPMACFDEMNSARQAQDWETARDRAEALRAWLNRGGFTPGPMTHDEVMTCVRATLRECRANL